MPRGEKKILVKVMSNKTAMASPVWTHLCYLSKDAHQKLLSLPGSYDPQEMRLNILLHDWAVKDFGPKAIGEISSVEDVYKLRKLIKEQFNTQWQTQISPGLYIQGIISAWVTKHIMEDTEDAQANA